MNEIILQAAAAYLAVCDERDKALAEVERLTGIIKSIIDES